MIKKKQPYTIKVEAVAPIELIYKIWAEDPEEALKLLASAQLMGPPKPILSKKRNIKATVYRYGASNIELTKRIGS